MRFSQCSVVLAVALACMCPACSDDDTPTKTTGYTNKLTLGSGTNAASTALTGEDTTFVEHGGVAAIYWRLESITDFDGNPVSIRIEKQSFSGYTLVGTYSSQTRLNYGHAVISSISVEGLGRFRATGFLPATETDVASCVFSIH